MTWDLPSITGQDWIVNATYDNGTSAVSPALKPGADYALGLMPTRNYTNSDDVIVNGFALFATQLVYNNNSQMEAQFWASPTNNTDFYSLVWVLEDSVVEAGSFLVVIKGIEGS